MSEPSAASGGYAEMMTNTSHAVLSGLGFSVCSDGLYRRTHRNDSLAVQADGCRLTLYAESDEQSVRIQIASLPVDGERLTQILKAIG